MPTQPTRQLTETARDRLLAAAFRVIREKGYHATSVDDLCTAAGVTKGAFFHHFPSKEDLAVAAAEEWSAKTGDLFANAPYHHLADPLERVLGYIDFRRALIAGTTAQFTCLVGTMAQEAFCTNPAIRDACFASMVGHARTLESDITAAIQAHGLTGSIDPQSLALHTQAVLQGAFILAKAKNDPVVAKDSVDHLGAYIRLLFRLRPNPKEQRS